MSSGTVLYETTRRALVVKTALSIIKLSFEPKLKWEFVYNGIKISALIDDSLFYAEIDARREGFKKGDVLEVDLRIQQEYDEPTRAFLNRSYTVVQVRRHVMQTAQKALVTAETPSLVVSSKRGSAKGRPR